MQKSKRYSFLLLGVTLLALLGTAAMVWFFDPYFHFHAPFSGVSYQLENERYQNDGITRHFEYEALITGTSMTQNFKTSELDALFDTTSIKIPFAGASFKEINDAVVRAKEYNQDLNLVVRGLDLYHFEQDKDYLSYDAYPTYLYDDNPFNDLQYLWNKDILTTDFLSLSLIPTLKGAQPTSFDDYSNWTDENTFGAQTVLASYQRATKNTTIQERHLTDADKAVIYDNVMQNLVQVAIDNPDTTFYYFYPPYSIAYFDDCNQQSKLYYELEKLEYTASLLLAYDNIQLYAFFDWTQITTDFDYYKDWTHYSETVSSMILDALAKDAQRLTLASYQDYFAEMTEYYTSYDYAALFGETSL